VNREEFTIVGWTDPEGARPRLGALLLAYYAPDKRFTYGRAGNYLSGTFARPLRCAASSSFIGAEACEDTTRASPSTFRVPRC
jgi:hypothetical protein